MGSDVVSQNLLKPLRVVAMGLPSGRHEPITRHVHVPSPVGSAAHVLCAEARWQTHSLHPQGPIATDVSREIPPQSLKSQVQPDIRYIVPMVDDFGKMVGLADWSALSGAYAPRMGAFEPPWTGLRRPRKGQTSPLDQPFSADLAFPRL